MTMPYAPNIPWEIGYLVDFMTAGKNKVSIHGRKTKTFPSKLFMLEADTIFFLNASIDKDLLQTKIENRIVWNYDQKVYSKADFLMLDILVRNFNQRPICFSYLGIFNHTIGLEPYLVQQGLVGRLLPIPLKPFKVSNRAFTQRILMRRTATFNLLENKGFIPYENESIIREIIKPSYYYLAKHFAEHNASAKAEDMIYKLLKILPNDQIRFDKYMFDIAKTCYQVHKIKTAREIIERVSQNIQTDCYFLLSISPKRLDINDRILKSKLGTYRVIIDKLSLQDPSFAKNQADLFNALLKAYNIWIQEYGK